MLLSHIKIFIIIISIISSDNCMNNEFSKKVVYFKEEHLPVLIKGSVIVKRTTVSIEIPVPIDANEDLLCHESFYEIEQGIKNSIAHDTHDNESKN